MKDTWWLSVADSTCGTVHKSLTQKLLLSRYIACLAMENAKVSAHVAGCTWKAVPVRIFKNGEVQSEDWI